MHAINFLTTSLVRYCMCTPSFHALLVKYISVFINKNKITEMGAPHDHKI